MNPEPREALWYGANKIIFQNRIIVWAVFIALSAGIFSWWAFTLFSIEEDNQARYFATQQTQSHSLRYIVVPQFAEDTSSWKTYRNEKYGFEFKYPQALDMATDESGIPDPSYIILIKFGANAVQALTLIIQTHNNPAGLSLEQEIMSCLVLNHGGPCYALQPSDPQTLAAYNFAGRLQSIETEPITVSGLSGLHLRLADPGGFSHEFFLNDPANHRFFRFSMFGNSGPQIFSEADLLNETRSILSTFKFFEPKTK